MDADGTGLTDLTKSPGEDYAPVWSPDGKQIAFVSKRNDETPQIYVMNSDGSDQARLTSGKQYNDSPDWSPDGSTIVWQQFERKGFIVTTTDIWAMKPDGTAPRQLTHASIVDPEFWTAETG
ncbi:MAG: translocation protein TolB [Chloroflexi bacterium ADurb.Bin180]|nr:MAG: translocation protein TolB [Chloroflexi bacterium ADurb.Bin180]